MKESNNISEENNIIADELVVEDDNLEIDLEDLVFKGMVNALSVFIILLCNMISLTMCVESLWGIGFRFRMISSTLIMPVLLILIAKKYMRVYGSNKRLSLVLLKITSLYFVIDILSLVFWSAVFGIFNANTLISAVVFSMGSYLAMIYLTFVFGATDVFFSKLDSNVQALKIDKKPIFNIETIKQFPVVVLLMSHVVLILNVYMDMYMGLGLVESAIPIVIGTQTIIMSLIVAVQGVICSIYKVRLIDVYKYVIVSIGGVSVGIYGPVSICATPIIIIFVIIGAVFGAILNFFMNVICRRK